MIQALLISSAIKIAAQFFPTLATKVAGKNAGLVAEQIVDAALSTASMGPDASVEDVISKLQSDKQAQQELQIKLATLDAQEHERDLMERQSARDYQLAAGVDGRKRANIMLVAVSTGLLLCILVITIPYFDIGGNTAALALITTIAGALLKMFSDAFAFEFGSSRGSKDKSDMIGKITDNLEEVGRQNARTLNRAVVTPQQPVMFAAPPAAAAPAENGDPADGGPESAPTEARPFTRQLVEGRLDLA